MLAITQKSAGINFGIFLAFNRQIKLGIMKSIFKIVIYSAFLLMLAGCELVDDSPADLTVNYINLTETYRSVALDLPNGSFMPDNPDFDINIPSTWTGNMAKYVNHNYFYSVSYKIENIGGYNAYDTEIDLHYIYDNGDEEVETIYVGDIQPDEIIHSSSTVGCTNKQLVACTAEVFWND